MKRQNILNQIAKIKIEKKKRPAGFPMTALKSSGKEPQLLKDKHPKHIVRKPKKV